MANDGDSNETLTDPVDRLSTLIGDLVSLVDTDLAIDVPDCPGWTLRDLLAHLGRVYGAVSAVVDQRATERVKPGPEAFLDPVLDDHGTREWFAERASRVVESLRSVSPKTPLWTWSSDQNAAFYRRRMVHETAVHLADAARALGRSFAVDRDVCVDGVDEYFDVMIPFSLARTGGTVPSGSLHLHCTDGPGEWLVVPEGDSLVVTREHAKGAVAWRGPARALLLAVWGRVDPELDVIGDERVSAEWSALAP
ncbi:MAG: hypothetical protein RIS41_425 [Actinomycetota bacterium]|jgi:uncharacterized protein (TIGR03083 family)